MLIDSPYTFSVAKQIVKWRDEDGDSCFNDVLALTIQYVEPKDFLDIHVSVTDNFNEDATSWTLAFDFTQQHIFIQTNPELYHTYNIPCPLQMMYAAWEVWLRAQSAYVDIQLLDDVIARAVIDKDNVYYSSTPNDNLKFKAWMRRN